MDEIIVGKRFGELTVIEKYKKSYKCRCDCGETTIATMQQLISGGRTGCKDCEYQKSVKEIIKRCRENYDQNTKRWMIEHGIRE